MGAMVLVYRLGLVGGGALDPRTMLLAGVAVGAFAAAVTTAIVSLAEASQLRNAFLWLWGGLSGASWQTLAVLAAWVPVPLAVLAAAARPLDLLALGEEPARYLGADVERVKRIASTAGRLQLVFGGKAHPRDDEGKAMIRRVVGAATALGRDVPVAYLENYDADMARAYAWEKGRFESKPWEIITGAAPAGSCPGSRPRSTSRGPCATARTSSGSRTSARCARAPRGSSTAPPTRPATPTSRSPAS